MGQEPRHAQANHRGNISDEDIAAAFLKWSMFGAAAHNLRERISRADLVARVEGSPELQRVLAKVDSGTGREGPLDAAVARAVTLRNVDIAHVGEGRWQEGHHG